MTSARAIGKYWKGVIGGAGPVVIAAQPVVTDGKIDAQEWVTIGVAVLVAAGVLSVPTAKAPGPR